jgi:hypothetical protein
MSFKAVLEADIKGFSNNIDKAISDVDRLEKTTLQKLSKVGDSFISIGKKASILSVAVAAAGAKAFSMAADFEDAMGATDQIFKDASGSVQAWANNLDTSYGIAKKEALSYSNLMGSMLVNIGKLTEEQASKQSAKLIELAGDLTAMYGGTTQEAVRALTGALKGNNTMLDNYGMAVNDALIKQKALEMGLISGTSEMSLQAKQAATLALIWEQTGAAQGQAAREADGASGAMRAFRTEVANLSTELGEVLLPIITPIISKLTDIVGSLRALSPEMQSMIVGIAGVTAVAGPLLVVIGKLLQALPAIKVAFTALTGPIGAITLAAAGLTAGIIYLVNRANEATTASEALAEANKGVEASVRKEKAELEKLLSIARDETKSKDMRLEAIRKLNSISKEHLGFITLETVNTDAAKNAVNGYTTAIERNARQKAISDKISKLYAEQLKYEEKIAREAQKIEEDKAKGFFGSNILLQSAFKIRRAEFQNELDNINESIKAYESLSEQYVATGETGAEAANKMAAAIAEAGEVAKLDTFQKLIGEQLNVRDAITKTTATIEDLQSKLVKLQAGILPSTNVRQELAETQQQINDLSTALDLLTGGRELNIKVNTNISGIEAEENKFLKDGAIVVPPIDTSLLENSLGQAKEMVTITSQDLGSLLTTGISMFAQTIGDAFAGNWDGLGAGLLKAVGSLAQQFGSLIVGMGVAALKLKSLIFNPPTAIAAGAALIALGAAASGAAQKMISSATGGGGYSSAPSLRNTGPGYAPSEYRGQYQDDFKVEFKIGTNELVGVLNTAEQRRNRL